MLWGKDSNVFWDIDPFWCKDSNLLGHSDLKFSAILRYSDLGFCVIIRYSDLGFRAIVGYKRRTLCSETPQRGLGI